MLAACSAYDPTLLDRKGTSFPAQGAPIAGATAGSGGAGSAGSNGAAGAPARDAAIPDAGTTTTPDAGNGDVTVEPCGDGKITGDELCDIAIADKMPGACPDECPSEHACQPRALEGSRCQAHCVNVVLPCTSGDGCCPAACGNPQDDDCSASCGDGVVQPDAGESCEVAGPDSELPEADACPTACADDANACTVETLMGSADNCNAICVTAVIDTVDDDDGCCPDRANSTVDDDCPVVCGNGVIEAGEDCDGGSNCDDQCRSTVVTEPQRCMSVFTGPAASCRDCMCTSCTTAVNDCFDSGNATRDANCAEIVACGLESGCRGSECWCGFDTDPDGTCLVGNGPCARLLDRIAGTPGPLSVYNQQFDPNTAIGRARAFSDCHGRSCASACQ
jgi:hypothetical protein